jgi:hypothetical protein
MACNPPYCGEPASWCGCPCPQCGCPQCPCYTSLTWKTTIPQLANPGCSGGDSIVIYNTISTDACCLIPLSVNSLGLATFKMQGGSGNVTITNSGVSYSCGYSSGFWRVGLDGTYASPDVTKHYNNCDTIQVNGGPASAPFCCPSWNTIIDSWTSGTLCPDAPPPSLLARRRKQQLIKSIVSRFKKIN